MCSWCRQAAARASLWKRCKCRGSIVAANGSTFSATRRPSDDLLRLVDDPHAAAAHLADQPEVAQRPHQRFTIRPDAPGRLLDQLQEAQHVADQLRRLGVPLGVFFHVGMLAPLLSLQELVSYLTDQHVQRTAGHGA